MKFVGLLVSAAVLVVAGPVRVHEHSTTPVPTTVERRAASCTFTDAAAASASKKSCSTIVLNGITVPAGTTLDMTGLKAGTQVSKPHLRTARRADGILDYLQGSHHFWLR
jgi:polygalacturonase